jgi:hypothetical protein
MKELDAYFIARTQVLDLKIELLEILQKIINASKEAK